MTSLPTRVESVGFCGVILKGKATDVGVRGWYSCPVLGICFKVLIIKLGIRLKVSGAYFSTLKRSSRNP
jgi:hypothetical protein